MISVQKTKQKALSW